MEILSAGNLGAPKVAPCFTSSYLCPPLLPVWTVSVSFCTSLSLKRAHLSHSGQRNSQFEPIVRRTTIEEEEEEEDIVDDYEEGAFIEDHDYFEEEEELHVEDGGGGGGIILAGTWWDKEALAIAEKVPMSFDGGLKLYAFKTLKNSTIQVRIEKLSNKYGSPSMTDIEVFSSAYQASLDEAAGRRAMPNNIYLEVSSPGIERVVRIPAELDQFKDRPMYVKYVSDVASTGSYHESDGVFRLVSFDLESSYCIWGLADVRINREQTGKGRPLSKKKREWRLQTSFDSLLLVRLYCDI